ncbi:TniQ family protein [Streptomyces sp. NBC_00882]|uniref:TniQ family protein n=1 Tax=Streptomyces TaxID=1883 RepID=UPI0038643C69
MNIPSSLRRLALVPEPYSGESLLSWVDAIARLNQVSRPMAMRMTGMANTSVLSDSFGHHVSDTTVRSVHLTTGLTEEQVRGITLARYAGGALDPLPQPDEDGQDALAGWRYWQRKVLRQHSSVCPVCLRENGARWLLKWRLIWSFACVEHQRYLLSECQGCDAGFHPPRPGTPQSWLCPGPALGWGRYKPSRPCGRDIRRMPAKPVHDVRLLDCQQRIDRLLDGSGDLPQEQVHELFGALYRSMQEAWNAERPVHLPRTDKVVHQAWGRGHAPDGFRWQPRPLIVAAALKIATEAGLGSVNGRTSKEADQVQARPNWGPPQPRVLVPRGEFQLPANRFGGYCHHDGCGTWVPAGHGARVNDASGGGTYCPQHADQFTARARPRTRSGPITSTDPRLRFLDARLREEEQRLRKGNAELREQVIAAQRLILDACVDTDPRTGEGKALRYAARCLLLPYLTHPKFRPTWLPRRGENPAYPVAESATGGTDGDMVDRG